MSCAITLALPNRLMGFVCIFLYIMCIYIYYIYLYLYIYIYLYLCVCTKIIYLFFVRPSSLGLVEMAYDKFISKNRKHIIGCDSDMCKFCVSAAVDTVNPGSTTSNYEYRSLFRNLQTHQLRRKSRSNKRMCVATLQKHIVFSRFFCFPPYGQQDPNRSPIVTSPIHHITPSQLAQPNAF